MQQATPGDHPGWQRWLGRIERWGNGLPHPATLFALLAFGVVLASALFQALGVSACHPATGEIITPVNLLSVAGLHRMILEAVRNFLAFPPLVLAIFFLSIFNPERGYSLRSFLMVSLAIGIIITPTTARIVRGAVLSIRNLQYVEAAEALGNGPLRMMLRHVLPNVAAPIIVIASIQVGNAILAEAALSFLALGIADAAHPSWGGMLQDTRQVWLEAWWTAVVPGAAISVAVLAFNLFGDALRDVLDPRLRQSS